MQHPKKERTLVIIKPDGVQRSLVAEIIKRYERVGLKLIAIKMLVPTADFVEAHYTLDPEWRRLVGEKRIKVATDKGEEPPSHDPIEISDSVLEKLRKYMTSGPVVAMVWEGAHVVEKVRKLTGTTEPKMSDIGTIRGDFVLDSYNMSDMDNRSVRNLVHASGSKEEADKEIKHWFEPSELVDYRLVQEQILYDVNLDGILE
jgi:nucleoside-diphosphate kinase